MIYIIFLIIMTLAVFGAFSTTGGSEPVETEQERRRREIERKLHE